MDKKMRGKRDEHLKQDFRKWSIDQFTKSEFSHILQGVSLTNQARHDLEINRHVVTDWFTVEDVLENESKRQQIFRLLRI